MAYTVLFENKPTATAPAAEVVITDVIDPSLDPATISIQNVRFGSTSIDFPEGTHTINTTADLRPANNIVVHISSSIVGNSLRLDLLAIDPITGKMPVDPSAGFLPPNKVPPQGEGSVSFTVWPRANLATAVQIRSRAQITFDINAPISTPEWFNTVDNIKPASKVLGLPANSVAVSFPVQ